MAKLANLVQESTATTGTGTVTLTSFPGFARFADRFSNGDLVHYAIEDGNNWEVGIGTVGASNTLARTTIQETFVSGVLVTSSPTAITLSGNATVRGVAPTQFLLAPVLTGALDLTAATAGQIKFPATQNSSAGANIFDDYEEGTWTPADQSGAGLTFTVTSANYTKFGRGVIAQAHITYPVTANGAAAYIGSFPFSSIAQHDAVLFTATTALVGRLNGTAMDIFASGSSVTTNATLSNQYVIFTIAYMTST
ncbi:MAG: hypothetical protein ACXWHZ_03590 [Usitatibacter sp.]